MSTETKYVKLRSKTAFEAQILITLLKAANVQVVERNDLRSDEFAIAQRLMNQTGTEILIPAAQLADAKRAIAEARADQRFPEELLQEGEQGPTGVTETT